MWGLTNKTIKNIQKKIILLIGLIWIVFSVVYIARDLWDDFKINQINEAYQQGRLDTINTLIQAAETSCQAVPVSNGQKTIEIINAACQK
ncbi:MAG: hypothetical protein ABII74_04260 [Elusimicrobiota bacterium]